MLTGISIGKVTLCVAGILLMAYIVSSQRTMFGPRSDQDNRYLERTRVKLIHPQITEPFWRTPKHNIVNIKKTLDTETRDANMD